MAFFAKGCGVVKIVVRVVFAEPALSGARPRLREVVFGEATFEAISEVMFESILEDMFEGVWRHW